MTIKHFIATFLVVMSIFTGISQNLVPNPDFEMYVPDSVNGSNGNGDIAKASYWSNPGIGTPDYFNSDHNLPNYPRIPLNECGTQTPHSGQAYAGIYVYEVTSVPNVREYIRTQLTSPLEANKYYRISLFTSLGDSSHYAATFGINLSSNPTTNADGFLLLVPSFLQPENPITDDANWTELSWTYLAQGGEQYLTIGGFIYDVDLNPLTVNGDYSHAYYYIDDVAVTYDATATVDDAANAFCLSVAPNPASDLLVLHLQKNVQIDQITVTNSVGKTISCNWEKVGENDFQLPVSEWSQGVYYFSSAKGTSYRFVKQ